MSPLEILEQLFKPTPTERETIRLRLNRIETSAPVSSEEEELDEPVATDRQNPSDPNPG